MRAAMQRRRPDRVPTMPQICWPHAVKVLCADYRRGIAEVAEDPAKGLDLVIEVARRYDVDGLRLFPPPAPVRVTDDGDRMVAADPKTGERVGRVDVLGGGAVIPDRPPLPVEGADDLRRISRPRCEELLETEPFILLRKALAKAKERFFVASSPGGFTMNFLSERRGRERALTDLICEPDLAKRIMDVGLEISIEKAKALVRCGVDALYIGDASASASVISPRQFEEFCLPRFRGFCEDLRGRGVLIYLHICGNSRPLLEMMAETGADCIEPLDPLGGVTVAEAKRRVGARVALMGGVNTLTLLNGTPQAVREEALGCCRAGGTAGYILAAGDMVPDFTPEANLRALVQAAKDSSYAV
jgi:hypothetical protein